MHLSNEQFERILALAAGSLGAEDASEIEELLAMNADARHVLNLIEMSRVALRSDDSLSPPTSALERLRKAFAETYPQTEQPGFIQRVRDAAGRMIAAVAYDSRAAGSLAGLRSAASAPARLTYQCENGCEIDLELTPLADGSVRLMGSIATDDTTALPRQLSIAATAAPDTVLTTADVDSMGVFALVLDPGYYDLAFESGEAAVVIEAIEIG